MALLERELELARISARLALSRAGDGSVLLIEGAGGIGKTALLLAAEREGGAGQRAPLASGADQALPSARR